MFGKKGSDRLKRTEGVSADRMARVIAVLIKQMQYLFAGVMSYLFKKIGLRHSKFVFFVALAATGLYSVYLLTTSLLHPKKGIQWVRPAAIQQRETFQHEQGLIDDTITIKKLRDFLFYFDSIKLVQPIRYDSILQSRPGLIDSIRMVEQIYYSQQKKEVYEK